MDASATIERAIADAEAAYAHGDSGVAEELERLLGEASEPRDVARAAADLAVVWAADRERCLAHVAQALAAQPGHAGASEVLARLRAAEGDTVEAAHRLAAAASAWPELWAEVASLEMEIGNLDAADRALRHGPDGAATQLRAEVGRRLDLRRRPDGEGVGEPGRVLIVVEHFFPSVGGTERLAEDLGLALKERGWTVEVAARPHPGRHRASHMGMPVHDLAGHPAEALRALLAQHHFDAVMSFAGPMSWPLLDVLALPEDAPRRVVVPCVNADGYAAVASSAAHSERYAALLAQADVVGYSSHTGFDGRLLDELGHPGTYLPNAVHRREPAAHGFRARHGMNPDAPLLIAVGNLFPEKNHAGLLRALGESHGNWHLAILGGGRPEHPGLALEVQRLAEADPRVTLAGPCSPEEVAAAMGEATLLLLPSLAEATPLVLLEAMSHELPWLATPTCGAATDHAGGLVLPLSRFGEAIETLCGDPAACARLGAAGHAHWRKAYSWDVVADRYDALLRGAASLAPTSAPAAALDATHAVRGVVWDASLAASLPQAVAA